MQENKFSFVVDAAPEEVWNLLHARPPKPPKEPAGHGEFGPFRRLLEMDDVRIEVIHEGDEHGEGLVRHCYFRVPKYLLSRGVGQSWEHITEVVPYESAKYYAIGKPLWSRAEGEHRLEGLGDGRTRVHFTERYWVFNPVMRFLLEKRVHRFISKDNNTVIEKKLNAGLRAARHAAAKRAADPESPG